MRKLLLAGALALIAAPVFAADMPLKSLVPRAPLFYGGSGFYYGMETGVTQTKLGGVAPGAGVNLYSAGGTMGLTAGWTRAVGVDRWVAFEASANWSNEDAAAVAANGAAVNVKRRYSGDLTAMYGAPMSVLAALVSNSTTAFGALPAPCGDMVACIAQNVHPFVLAGIHYGRTTTDIANVPGLAALEENHNKLRFKAGVGTMVQVTNSTVWRTTADWTFGSQGKGAGFLFVPGAPINEGGTITAKTGLFYAF